MKKSEVIYETILKAGRPITPQEVRDAIKVHYPQFYATDSHKRAVEKKTFNSLDHALLADVYTYVKSSDKFLIDQSVKPYTISFGDADLFLDWFTSLTPSFHDTRSGSNSQESS